MIMYLFFFEEHRLRVFENKVLRKILELSKMKLQENGERYGNKMLEETSAS